MSEIDKFLAALLDRAGQEARDDGSAAVEAHHLLLALAALADPTTRQLLGLDYEGVRAALDREFEQSLAAVGVTMSAGPSSPRPGTPPLGATVKLAMERGLASVRRKRDLRPVHLLLGVAQARAGTVPRALAIAGVDPADLTQRITRTLGW